MKQKFVRLSTPTKEGEFSHPGFIKCRMCYGKGITPTGIYMGLVHLHEVCENCDGHKYNTPNQIKKCVRRVNGQTYYFNHTTRGRYFVWDENDTGIYEPDEFEALFEQ